MKKFIESLKYGLSMYANSTHGDINWKYESKNIDEYYTQNPYNQSKRKKNTWKKGIQSSSHLRRVK